MGVDPEKLILYFKSEDSLESQFPFPQGTLVSFIWLVGTN